MKVEVEGGELAIKNGNGDIVIIPKKYRIEVEDMIEEECWGCIDKLVSTLPNIADFAQEGSVIPKNPILESIYTRYPAFKNMGTVTLHPDSNFTKDKTGVGDIEYFGNENEGRQSVIYENGYEYKHPKPGTHGIVYNPETNNEQNIMLDMLHGMTKDETYAKHRNEFKDSFLNSRYGEDYKREWKNYNEETKGNNDGEEQFKNNWVDGQIRALMFEGTDEDFEKSRYWKDAKKEYLQDPNIDRTFNQIQNYLKTGKGYVLPEVKIEGKTNKKLKLVKKQK